MLVKLYSFLALLVLGTVALGLFDVINGEQTVKILLGIVALIQGAKEFTRELRNEKAEKVKKEDGKVEK